MTEPLDPIEMAHSNASSIVTDLTINFCSASSGLAGCALDPLIWQRLEKNLYLHTSQQSAWLHTKRMKEETLPADDLVVVDVKVGQLCPKSLSNESWERRPGGIWVLRRRYNSASHQTVTDVDILYGIDAIDPRPHWDLIRPPLQVQAQLDTPVASLSVRHGPALQKSDREKPMLRAKDNGTFKIVQISDTHMVTGVRVCKDALGPDGQLLPESDADPLTVEFIGKILDTEKPDLVILTGDQLHHDIPDSQSALFKVVSPMIERSIPFAVVFGNHDSEGSWASSRTVQMSILEDLPFSLCQSGSVEVDGVGNYYLQIYGQGNSNTPLATLYLLDSHGEIPSKIENPDYDWIKQSQIDWFKCTSQALRKSRERQGAHDGTHLSLAFMHIPLPEYADGKLVMAGGHRREPTEGPSFNSRFYDVLASQGIAAMGCGHDHVNDFCALLPQRINEESEHDSLGATGPGPWLCYGGGTGFGGYDSYGGKRYHRRSRVWELDTGKGDLKTWKRVEYAQDRVDELVLVKGGVVVSPND